jgi:K+:H+ antiporter
VWVGVPLSRVMRRVSQVRGERYGLLRGLFVGRDDEVESGARLHSVALEPGALAIGRTLAELDLPAQVRVVRRRGVKAKLDPASAGALESGDVVVLFGTAEALAAAEERLTAT